MKLTRRDLLQGLTGVVAVEGWAHSSLAALAEASVPRAQTTNGPVAGYAASARVAAFKGIQYGADTRSTRFKAPRRPEPWTAVRSCVAWPDRAPQQSPDRGGRPARRERAVDVTRGFNAVEGVQTHYHLPADEGAQSEDCLHLNIWTPRLKQKGARLPVLFYIHGGAYNNGTVNAAIYDGTRLAERGAVVVTVNHRLNAFGYLYLAQLAGKSYAESGNAGMLDLVLALEWVRDNIAEFGGDRERVTIFGQSGGGAKCATLMAMPQAHGLFQRVWTMSGQQVWAVPKDKATANAEVALAAMGVKGPVTADKLNALTIEQIQAGARTTGNWLPVKDDVVLLRDPFDPDAPPMSDSVPMVLGNTKDEIYGSSAWQRTGLTWDTLEPALNKELGVFRGPYTTAQIVEAYRGWYPAYTPNDVFTAAMAAFRSWPGQVIEAERRAANPVAARHTWVYQMDWPSPTADGRAPHTVDIAFVFDNVALSPGVVGASDAEVAAAQPLARVMSQRLLDFAATGVPGSQWPVYDLRERETMLFDNVSRVVSNPRGREREMMVGAHYRQPGT